MRNAYTIELNELNDDLCALAATAREAMVDASRALLERDVHRAEASIARSGYLAELGTRCENRAVALLARQAPVGTDLRQVFSTMRISADLARMGDLAVHIAEAVRRRFPDEIVPDYLEPKFEELGDICLDMADRVRRALGEIAVEPIAHLDDLDARVDRLHDEVIESITDETRGNDVKKAVDVALLCRFYQRYAAQAVDVGQRVVFLVSGSRPENSARAS
ncbi:phosphate transport system regulatory protein PhoU [Rhodococcoides trifolii]|uniref:Phosphate transport system regulatory protein PhoU n=1 Tax=Rhodococcoides trifolii TaxID=908250 RepID=A0A917LIE0_9NOCA|nr:PhoU domain-containing protein [Rhodococcus trifolii]GGG28068.1 phosphate transport system regulatory protein PhoU [Rhodococcus trifolii]